MQRDVLWLVTTDTVKSSCPSPLIIKRRSRGADGSRAEQSSDSAAWLERTTAQTYKQNYNDIVKFHVYLKKIYRYIKNITISPSPSMMSYSLKHVWSPTDPGPQEQYRIQCPAQGHTHTRVWRSWESLEIFPLMDKLLLLTKAPKEDPLILSLALTACKCQDYINQYSWGI